VSRITQAELKAILNYNPNTGIFTWVESNNRKIVAGSVAGSKCIINGYIKLKLNGFNYPAHRLAWLYVYGCFPAGEIDHINHIRDDNRIINLRDVSLAINAKNLSMYKCNVTQVTGVTWHKTNKRWQAQIGVDDKGVHLGSFTDKFCGYLCPQVGRKEI